MDTEVKAPIERAFSSLPFEEREAVIRYGVAFRLSNLRKRLFLAESKVRHFEEKYNTTLAHLSTEGLPDDATYEMHEDYIMWHHWSTVAHKVKQDIDSLQEIAQYGLQWEYLADVSC